jgi:hypothetical protein
MAYLKKVPDSPIDGDPKTALPETQRSLTAAGEMLIPNVEIADLNCDRISGTEMYKLCRE